MIEWTRSAEAEFERHFQEWAEALKASGADTDEVRSDLKRHFEEECLQRGIQMITSHEIQAFLSRRGFAARAVDSPSLSRPTPSPAPLRWGEAFVRAFHILGGIILPALALLLECTLHITAGVAFNPIPNWWSIILVALVPLSNLWLYALLSKQERPVTQAAFSLNAAVLSIAGIYSLLYIPLIPIAVMGTIYFGIGALGLTPHTALLSALLLRRAAARREQEAGRGRGRLLFGLVAGALSFILPLLPSNLTLIAMRFACFPDSETRLEAIHYLRSLGDEETMLRSCYDTIKPLDFLNRITTIDIPLSPQDARHTYFRTFGRSYTESPRPKVHHLFVFAADPDLDEGWFDDAQGSQEVGNPVKDLTLRESRIDGSFDPDAGLGYFEWTMLFQNGARWNHEARTLIQLPPGGVVSRATLWVHGEEREAAFGSRGATTEAYQNVVSERRDPLLVTTQGAGRVLAQCFPVPAGGSMKIRLGITVPLRVTRPDRVSVSLPSILSANVAEKRRVKHAVWLEATQDIFEAPAGWDRSSPRTVRGELSDPELMSNDAFEMRRDTGITTAWTPDPDSANHVIIGEWSDSRPASRKWIIVIDGSSFLEPHREAIASFLEKFPEDCDLSIAIADDASSEGGEQAATIRNGRPANLAKMVRELKWNGGMENIGTLCRAWDNASRDENSGILWLHGPQPDLREGVESLMQRRDRSASQVVLHEYGFGSSENVLLKKFDDREQVVSLAHRADAARTLENWRRAEFDSTMQSRQTIRKIARADIPLSGAKETSRHLARLWAFDGVKRILRIRRPESSGKAASLAVRHQLVTPVTGAVVLETKAQYQAADLKPVDPATVPTIPEPPLVLLIMTAVPLLYLAKRRAMKSA